jgi:hypothetical protein
MCCTHPLRPGAGRFIALLLVALIAFVSASPAEASPITIGFNGVPSGPGIFVGPVTENGFVYSSVGYVNGLFSSPIYGNPGAEMEATALLPDHYVDDAGILQFVSATAGQSFQFLGMDIAQRDTDPTATHTIRVEGFFQGSLMGTEDFTTPMSDEGSTNSPYMTVAPTAGLSGIIVDELLVHLPGRSNAGSQIHFYTRLDNVQLEVNAIPAPAALPLAACALLGMVLQQRTRRQRHLG